MFKKPTRPIYAAGILEKSDDEFLIARSVDEAAGRVWLFPRGPANPGESAEAAMRRIFREQLGLDVEIVIGQPPLTADLDGRPVEVRYFFCVMIGGTQKAGPYAELRWVPKSQLREYEFDAYAKPVVEWLVSG